MMSAQVFPAYRRAIRLWLYAVAALVLAMVLVGGATRLTESGLSITQWQPVMGALPPLDEAQWQAEFENYQAIPQYRELNRGMNLSAFKTIYWWEWTHRLLARAVGVAFLLPLLWFLWRGSIGGALRRRLWLIFGLGALQGVVGWWMVASGLVERVEVSQYRLATHLVLACVIYIATLWTARELAERPSAPVPWRIRSAAIGLVVLVLAQIYLGALVAGLRAGSVYNTWPLIGGALLPGSAQLFFDAPVWRNFFENKLTVQFEHRLFADVVLAAVLVHAVDVVRTVKRGPLVTGALALAAVTALQIAVGIVALLWVVPIALALLHQALAMAVLTVATVHAASVIAGPSEARSPESLIADGAGVSLKQDDLQR